jgi:Dolichyl-phosphate-mannose-protein mannosyltransferase
MPRRAPPNSLRRLQPSKERWLEASVDAKGAQRSWDPQHVLSSKLSADGGSFDMVSKWNSRNPTASSSRPHRLRFWLLAGGVVALGILLRSLLFLRADSLWNDEALLALNIVNRSFSELLAPLDYMQAAPAGFLLATKLTTRFLGTGERALRLIPFLAGLAVPILFLALCRKRFSLAVLLFGLALVSFSQALISYSAEFKQYEVDVAAALGVFYVVQRITENRATCRQYLVAALFFSIAIWFSHAALLAVGAAGIVLLALRSRGSIQLSWRTLIAAALLVGLSMALDYWCFVRPVSRIPGMVEWWTKYRDAYPQFGPTLPSWIVRRLAEMSQMLGIYRLRLPFYLFLCLSFVALVASGELLGILSATLVTVAFVACMVASYPLADRLILFLIPVCVLALCLGCQTCLDKLAGLPPRLRCGIAASLFTIGGAFVAESVFRASRLHYTRDNENLKAVMQHLVREVPSRCVIIVHEGPPTHRSPTYIFKYYVPRIPIRNAVEYTSGEPTLERARRAIRHEGAAMIVFNSQDRELVEQILQHREAEVAWREDSQQSCAILFVARRR